MKIVIAILMLIVLSVGCTKNSDVTERVELKLQCNLDNNELLSYYSENIDDLKKINKPNYFTIYYAQCDINEDGNTDYISIFESAINSGSHGTPIDILINDGSNHYDNVGGRVVARISDKTKIFILSSKSKFNDIEISDSENNLVIHYKKGHYELKKQGTVRDR